MEIESMVWCPLEEGEECPFYDSPPDINVIDGNELAEILDRDPVCATCIKEYLESMDTLVIIVDKSVTKERLIDALDKICKEEEK